MSIPETYIANLLLKRLNGELTAEESITLDSWIEDSVRSSLGLHEVLEEELIQQAVMQSIRDKTDNLSSNLLARIKGEMGQDAFLSDAVKSIPVVRIPFLRSWGWVAASIILVIGTAVAILVSSDRQSRRSDKQMATTVEVAPGKDGAVLTLADGSQIVLDSLRNGFIAQQNGTDVTLKNGLLAYDPTAQSSETVVYNTITTLKGRQFAVTLPDGSRVWLNAASSISFPTAFNTQERRVIITGEAFLEVAADKSKPFFVSANDMEVQVLGTSFNISAYNDEPNIKTTLLDGSIKVLKSLQPHTGIILKPGQQAVISESIILNKTVDVEQVLAWKNGVFNFNGATLEEFMRQIARWYDLKIVYQGAIPHKTFKGKIGRDLQLSQIMKLLTQFNIKYQLIGNTITIESQ